MSAHRYQTAQNSIEKIVSEHEVLIRKVAHHVHSRVRSIVEFDDLLQIGLMGLIEAAQRYTRQEGISFESYAVIRVRGAINDFLRKNSALSRKSMKINKEVNAARNKLVHDLGRAPEGHEVAKAVGLSLDEFTAWEQTLNSSYHNSIQDEYDEHSMWFATADAPIEQELDRARLKEALLYALKTLPEREALVLQLYYVEELNLFEIAAVLDVTSGRVSQIKSSAFKKMQPLLKDYIDNSQAA
jgi:RNA polymerase sigma factor for flagellar operon FliA